MLWTVTAMERAAGAGPDEPHPLVQGATPAVIRSRLFPEDAERFDAEWARTMDAARTSQDLSAVLELVEHWRGIAVAQSDPETFRRTVRRWAEIATGEPTPSDEDFATTRARAGI